MPYPYAKSMPGSSDFLHPTSSCTKKTGLQGSRGIGNSTSSLGKRYLDVKKDYKTAFAFITGSGKLWGGT